MRAAATLALAGAGRHPPLHGHRPQRRDGLQSPRRSRPRRRAIPAPPAAICPPASSASASVPLFAIACMAPASSLARSCSCPIGCRSTSPSPCSPFLAGYSFTKRFTSLAHFWLGAALGLSPVAAWIAIRGDVVLAHPADLLPALVLGGAVLTWVAGFDIIYACQDYDVDSPAGLHSVPVRARHRRLAPPRRRLPRCSRSPCWRACRSSIRCFGWIYWAGIAAVAVLLIYEHALVRPDDLTRVNTAFFNVNAIISLGLFAVGTLDLLIHRAVILSRTSAELPVPVNPASAILTSHAPHIQPHPETDPRKSRSRRAALARRRPRSSSGPTCRCPKSASWPTWSASGRTATPPTTTSTRISTRRTSASIAACSAPSAPICATPRATS